MEQLRKAMAKFKKKGGKDQNEQNKSINDQSLNSEKTIIKDYKKTVSGLKGEVKYLKIALLGVFILNLLILYCF